MARTRKDSTVPKPSVHRNAKLSPPPRLGVLSMSERAVPPDAPLEYDMRVAVPKPEYCAERGVWQDSPTEVIERDVTVRLHFVNDDDGTSSFAQSLERVTSEIYAKVQAASLEDFRASSQEWKDGVYRSARNAYFVIVDDWNLDDHDAAQLGGFEDEEWKSLRQCAVSDAVALQENQLLRISAMIGAYEALHSSFDGEYANRWVTLENTDTLFNGERPLDVMLSGGLTIMKRVRNHLEEIESR